jgi:hypothetical protein
MVYEGRDTHNNPNLITAEPISKGTIEFLKRHAVLVLESEKEAESKACIEAISSFLLFRRSNMKEL